MQLVLTVADVAAQMLTSVGSNPEVATGRFVVRSAPRIIAAPFRQCRVSKAMKATSA
jgi:hypothetical protein